MSKIAIAAANDNATKAEIKTRRRRDRRDPFSYPGHDPTGPGGEKCLLNAVIQRDGQVPVPGTETGQGEAVGETWHA
jgi:hypothetical protein